MKDIQPSTRYTRPEFIRLGLTVLGISALPISSCTSAEKDYETAEQERVILNKYYETVNFMQSSGIDKLQQAAARFKVWQARPANLGDNIIVRYEPIPYSEYLTNLQLGNVIWEREDFTQVDGAIILLSMDLAIRETRKKGAIPSLFGLRGDEKILTKAFAEQSSFEVYEQLKRNGYKGPFLESDDYGDYEVFLECNASGDFEGCWVERVKQNLEE